MLFRSSTAKPLVFVLLLLLTVGVSTPANAGLKSLFKKDREKQAQKIQAESYTPGPGWEGYFRLENGLTQKIQQPVEVHSDREWMGLLFTDYQGPKTKIGVMKIENRTPNAEAFNMPGYVEVPTAGIEEVLSTALFRTHRFELVERKRVGAVMAEQDFGATDRVSQPTAAGLGKIQGADYVIYGVVNEWTPHTGGKSFGNILGKGEAEVAMSFTVTDATSGQVVFQTTERARAGNWSISAFGASAHESSPTGYAVQSCINKAVYKIAMSLEDRAWRGSVVKVSGDQVIINAGRNKGMEAGMTLKALAKGEELVDPETGLSLGAELESIGSLMITSVADNHSSAAILEGCKGLQVGDRVELSSKQDLESSTPGTLPTGGR